MFHRLIQTTSLRKKIFLSFTTLLIAALLLLQLVNSIQSYGLLEEKLTTSVLQSLKLGLMNIDFFLEDADNFASGMITEPEIQASLSTAYDHNSLDTKLMLRSLDRTIKRYSSSRPYLHKVYPVNQNGDILDNALHGMTLPSFYHSSKLQLSAPHRALYMTSSPTVVSIRKDIYPLPPASGSHGMLIADLDFGIIEKTIQDFTLPMDGDTFLLTPEFELLSQSGTGKIPASELRLLLQNEGLPSPGNTVKLQGTSYIALSETSDISGWHLVSLIPRSLFARSTAIQMKATLILFLFCMIAAVLISRKIISYLYEPLDLLTASMKKAEDGYFNSQVSYHRKDELLPLVRGYNSMLSRIQTLIEEVTGKERAKRQAELYALQAQINPHFLYNTLNSIRYLAKVHQVPEIRDTTSALIRLSRASLDSDKFIELQMETALVDDYLLIQSMRYGNILNYCCTGMDEQLGCCLLPRFSIQPLIENALFHGILPKGSGNIHLNISGTDTLLTITVTDNGIGMNADQLAKLNETLHTELPETSAAPDSGTFQRFKNIGIENINQRIKLNFGSKYGIKLTLLTEGGICAVMTLPRLTSLQPEEQVKDTGGQT